MILANQEEVHETISSWIIEEGNLNNVAKRLKLNHAALYRVYSQSEHMSVSRWEKWKHIWSGKGYLYRVTYFMVGAVGTKDVGDLDELFKWFELQQKRYGRNVIITMIEKLE